MVRRTHALSQYLAAIDAPTADDDAATEKQGGENKGGSEGNRDNGKMSTGGDNSGIGSGTVDNAKENAGSASSNRAAKTRSASAEKREPASAATAYVTRSKKWQPYASTNPLSTTGAARLGRVANLEVSVQHEQAQQHQSSSPASLGYNSLITPSNDPISDPSYVPSSSNKGKKASSDGGHGQGRHLNRPNPVLSPEEFSAFAVSVAPVLASPGMASVISTASARGVNSHSGNRGGRNTGSVQAVSQQQQHPQSTSGKRQWPPVSAVVTSADASASKATSGVRNIGGSSSKAKKTTNITFSAEKKSNGASPASDKYKMVNDADTGRSVVKLVGGGGSSERRQPRSATKNENPAEVSHDSGQGEAAAINPSGKAGSVAAVRNLFGSPEKPAAIRSRIVTVGSTVSSSSSSMGVAAGGTSGNKWRRPPTYAAQQATGGKAGASAGVTLTGAAAVGRPTGASGGSGKKKRRDARSKLSPPPPRRFFPPSPSEGTKDDDVEWGKNTLDESFVDAVDVGHGSLDASGLWGAAETEDEAGAVSHGDASALVEESPGRGREDSREEIECATPERTSWRKAHQAAANATPGNSDTTECSNATGASGTTSARGTPDTSKVSNVTSQRRQKQQERGQSQKHKKQQDELTKTQQSSPFGRHILRQRHRARPSMNGVEDEDHSSELEEEISAAVAVASAATSTGASKAKEEGASSDGSKGTTGAAGGDYGPRSKKKQSHPQQHFQQNQFLPNKPSSSMIDRVGASLLQKRHQSQASSATPRKQKDQESPIRPPASSTTKLPPLDANSAPEEEREGGGGGATAAAKRRIFGEKYAHALARQSSTQAQSKNDGGGGNPAPLRQQKQPPQQDVEGRDAADEKGGGAADEKGGDAADEKGEDEELTKTGSAGRGKDRSPPHRLEYDPLDDDSEPRPRFCPSPKRLKQQLFSEWDGNGTTTKACPTPVASSSLADERGRVGSSIHKAWLQFSERGDKIGSGTNDNGQEEDHGGNDGGDPTDSPFSTRSPGAAFAPWTRSSPPQRQAERQKEQEQNQEKPPPQPHLDGAGGNDDCSPIGIKRKNRDSKVAEKFLAALGGSGGSAATSSTPRSFKEEDERTSKKSTAAAGITSSGGTTDKHPKSTNGAESSEVKVAGADDSDGDIGASNAEQRSGSEEEPSRTATASSESHSLGASTLTTRISMLDIGDTGHQGRDKPQQQKQFREALNISPPDGKITPNVPPTPRSAAAAAAAASNAASEGFNHRRAGDGDCKETVCGMGAPVVLAFSSTFPSGHNLHSLVDEVISPLPGGRGGGVNATTSRGGASAMPPRSTPCSTPTLKAGAAAGRARGASATPDDPVEAARRDFSGLDDDDTDADDELSTTSSITTRPSMAPFMRGPSGKSGGKRGSTPKFPPAQVGAATPASSGDVKVMRDPTSAELWRRREASANARSEAAAANAESAEGSCSGGGGMSNPRSDLGLPPPTPLPPDLPRSRSAGSGGAGGKRRASSRASDGGDSGIMAARGGGSSPQLPPDQDNDEGISPVSAPGVEEQGDATHTSSVISERLVGYLQDMELRMENRMLRLESRMEERIQARMEYLEQKVDARMDEIQNMLRLLIETGGGGASTSFGGGGGDGTRTSWGTTTLESTSSGGPPLPQRHSAESVARLGAFPGHHQPRPQQIRRAVSAPGIDSGGAEDTESDSDSDDDVGADGNTQCSI